MNITEFKYRYDSYGKQALVLYRYATTTPIKFMFSFVLFILLVFSGTLMGRNSLTDKVNFLHSPLCVGSFEFQCRHLY
jgi:hypothetical protein